MKPIFILNGPNLNLIGQREPEIYGTATLRDVEAETKAAAAKLGLEVEFRQTNHEGTLVDWLQEARHGACAVILNAGAYTHTSIAVLDALRVLSLPVIEVHLSNIFKREPFRHQSYVSLGATGIICGFGARSYLLAVQAVSPLVTPSAHAARGPDV